MRIISQTSNEIKIADLAKGNKNESINTLFQILLPIIFIFGIPIVWFCFASISFITNVFADFYLTGVTRVSCDRVEPKQVDCQVSKSKLFDFVQGESTTIKFVESAKYSGEYIGYVPIVTDYVGSNYGKGDFQITSKIDTTKSFESYQDSANKTVGSVNSFLASQQKTLIHIADDRTNSMVLVSLAIELFLSLLILLIWFFILFSIYASFKMVLQHFSGKIITEQSITLNKSQRSFKYIGISQSILGKKTDDCEFNCNFTDVSKVDVRYYSDRYDNISYVPRILMKSGIKHDLDRVSDRQVAIKIANNLNRFMGLPEEEDPVVKE